MSKDTVKGNDRPNVIFFFSDQQRWDTVGTYGQELDVTPNLDRMAEEGVKFEYAFTPQPVCGPARSVLQTGKYATETGCYRNNIALPQDEKTIAHWFSEAGYEVGYIGKWHLASTGGHSNEDIGPRVDHQTEPIPLEWRGGWKDHWLASDILEFTSHSYDGHMFNGEMERVEFPEDRYRVDCVTDYALNYLRDREGEREPLFLFLSYIEPHHQNDHDRYEGPRGSEERFGDFPVPGDLRETEEEGDWPENYPDYLGCCHSLDENLGRLMDELERQDMAEDTVVVYTSDHGSHFKTRNEEYKRSPHEASIRVPLIVSGPGFRGGETVSELTSLIDLPPTLLRLADLEVPAYMRGRPLQETLGAGSERPREEIFTQISESEVGRGLRTHRWKYSVHAPEKDGRLDAGSDRYQEEYLYDLEEDPHERNNLVADPAYEEIRESLRERLKERMAGAGEEVPHIDPRGGGK